MILARNHPSSLLALVIACWLLVGSSRAISPQQPPTHVSNASPLPPGMQRRTVEGIENFIQVSDRVYSGGEPTAAGLEHLQKLGVTILLSVDGLAPDREAAEKLGMKYVHIPMGYDGIEPQQIQNFVTLMARHKGKLFVHCHHGKHRGPAAVAACLICAKEMSKEQAAQFMRGAGTSKEYKGLWKAIADLDVTHYEPQEFSVLLTASPEKSMAQWMAELDRAWEIIIEEQKQTNAEINVEQLAIVTQAFRESARVARASPENLYGDKESLERLIQWLDDCEQQSKGILEHSPALAHEKARDSIQSLAKQCVDCHAQFRN
jgi:protein tyrosine phosphatase (PTP) superfamily phosphohydrolase (DUF442 family)